MEQRLVEHGQQGGVEVLGEGVEPLPVLAREHHRLRNEAERGEEVLSLDAGRVREEMT